MKNRFLRSLSVAATVLAALFFLKSVYARESVPELEVTKEYRLVYVDGSEESNPRRLMNVKGYSYSIEMREYEGDDVLVMERTDRTEEGHVVKWELFMEPTSMSLIEARKKVISEGGHLLEESREIYMHEVFDYGENAHHFQTIPAVASTLNMEEGSVNRLSFVFSPEAKPWTVTITAEGEETVTVPAGTFQCVRFRMESDEENLGEKKGLGSYFMKFLLPTYYMWVDKEPPHTMVKYQGKLGGFTSPEQAQELVKIVPE